jgi:hypothetical protein
VNSNNRNDRTIEDNMRIKDMIGAMQLGKKKQVQVRELSTVWSEQADDGPQAVPLPEYPRPQLRRSDWTCLNGWWEYGICPGGKAGKASRGEADGKILVPFSRVFDTPDPQKADKALFF